MKRITVIFLLTALLFSMISCGEKESPPAYLPSVRYDGQIIPDRMVLTTYSDGPGDGGAPEAFKTAGEIIASDLDKISFTKIENKKLELVNGSDKNADFSIVFEGIYTDKGEKTEYTESDMSGLPDGRYVICARVRKKMTGINREENYYLFAGVEKSSGALTFVSAV